MQNIKASVEETLTPERILEVAREQVRRFGEAKTNVMDIARALGTSHTTIYRHFRSKAEVFDAIIISAMRDEEELPSVGDRVSLTLGFSFFGPATRDLTLLT